MLGNGIWVLKEQLKHLKWGLKSWNLIIFGDIFRKKEQIIHAIRSFDVDDEISQLDNEGREARK